MSNKIDQAEKQYQKAEAAVMKRRKEAIAQAETQFWEALRIAGERFNDEMREIDRKDEGEENGKQVNH